MFKILHIADSHFQSKRLDECKRNADYIVDYAMKYEPDLIVHAGDLHHRNTTINSPEFLAAINFIYALSEQTQVIIIRGNHDPVGTIEMLNIIPNVIATEETGFIDKQILPSGLSVYVMPYQTTTAADSDTVTSAHLSTSDSMREEISVFANIKNKDVKIVIGHFSVAGAELANSERILGNEVMLSPDAFKGIDGTLLGHIHRSDQSVLEGLPIAYSGSHYRTRFDEMMKPGFRIWEFELNKLKKMEFVPTPAKDMIQFDLDIDQTKEYIRTNEFPHDIPNDADIKIVFSVPEGMSSMIDTTKLTGGDNSTIAISKIIEPKALVRSKKIATLKNKNDIFKEWASASKIKMSKSVSKKFDELVEQNASD